MVLHLNIWIQNMVILKMDYKFYHLNLLCNDECIDHYQTNHRDFDIKKPKIVLKKKLIKKPTKK